MSSMTRVTSLFVALLATLTIAEYDSFHFTSTSNPQCEGLPFNCPPPFACSRDTTVDKYYCCIPGQDNVCWTGSTQCSGRNSQTAGNGQLDCGEYCCLDNREECTQRKGQINICWATAINPLEDVTVERMNDTFSSLSSSQPTATSFTFALAQVTSATSTEIAGSATSTSISDPSATAAPIEGGSSNSSSALSGGAIAGIVVGVVIGLGLVGAAIFLFFRFRKNRVITPNQEPYRSSAYAEKHQYGDMQPRPIQPALVEMDAGPQPQPIREWYGQAAEIDSTTSGTYMSHTSAELPGTR